MIYESSYESGRKPFKPDLARGYWTRPTDFTIISIGLAFKMDFFILPMEFFMFGGFWVIIPYLICLGLYVVPIMQIQSFMGQFSNSGYISAFRISPIFKGMGYISLGLNFSILAYYSVLATVPMLFLFNSLKPALPWSCEHFDSKLYTDIKENQRKTICNVTDSTTKEPSYQIIYELPSVLFFQSHIADWTHGWGDLIFSWELLLCTATTWTVIALLFYKFFDTAKIGTLLRYGIWSTIVLLLICTLRLMSFPGVTKGLERYFFPKRSNVIISIPNVVIYSLYAFGSGWGSIISLSSHNKFKTNIMQSSWIICISQMLIVMLINFIACLLDWHIREIVRPNLLYQSENHWKIYLWGASAMAHLRYANLWSFLFYAMLTIAALIVMITQLYAFLVTIFDEFEILRAHKMRVTFIVIGILAVLSLYHCTNEGVANLSTLSMDSLFTQAALNVLLVIVVLWIYGRERFQRDIECMLNRTYPKWKINLLRFFTPIFFIIIMYCSIIFAHFEHLYHGSTFALILVVIFLLIPWLSIPIYGIFTLWTRTGSWATRIKRSCRPTDWYPSRIEDRQRYEEAIGDDIITHQLNELREEII